MISKRQSLKRILFIVLCLCILNISCSQQKSSSSDTNPVALPIPRIWAKDFAPGQLEAHYLKHKDEFGDITQQEYLENARTLLNAAPDKDILEKVRANGEVLHYRIGSGGFAVMTKTGRIKTYFKTDYHYWLRQ